MKTIFSLLLCGLFLTVPKLSYATGCHNNAIVERVVVQPDYVIAVPNQKLVERVVFNDYDYQPVAVERVVVRQNVVQPVQVVEKVVQRNVQRVQRVRVRQRVQKVQVNRNVQRVIVNGY